MTHLNFIDKLQVVDIVGKTGDYLHNFTNVDGIVMVIA